MATINSFRLILGFAVALIVWFAFFSEKNTLNRKRRAPVKSVSDIPDKCTEDGLFAMTFDGGPTSGTQGIISALNSVQAKATFHVVTEYISTPAVYSNLKAAYDAGHVIGLRFDPKKLADQSPRAIKSKLMEDSAKIYKYIKVYPKYLRITAGDETDVIMDVAFKLGFVVTRMNLDSGDYVRDANNNSIIGAYQNTINTVAGSKASFITGHNDINLPVYNDQTIIPGVVRVMTGRGFQPVSLDKCTGDSPYRENNDDPDNEVGTPDPENPQKTKSSAARANIFFALMVVVAAFLFLF